MYKQKNNKDNKKGWNAATIVKPASSMKPSQLVTKEHKDKLQQVLVLDSASTIDLIRNQDFSRISRQVRKLSSLDQ